MGVINKDKVLGESIFKEKIFNSKMFFKFMDAQQQARKMNSSDSCRRGN